MDTTFTQKKDRLIWLDILKGIGIILVVVGHVYENQIFYDWIYSFHMPLFFFAGGWIYRKRKITLDIQRRLRTIIVPYFVFGFCTIEYFQLIESKYRNANMGFLDSCIALLRGQYEFLEFFNGHLWFLPAFFITVVMYNVFMHIGSEGKKITYILAVLLSATYIVCSFFGGIIGIPWGVDQVFKYIGFYTIGNIVAENFAVEERLKKIRSVRTVLIAVLLLLINFILSYYQLSTGMMWFVTAFIGIASIVLFSICISKIGKLNNILQYSGKISLVILCLHGPIYRIIIQLLSMLINMPIDKLRGDFLLSTLVSVITVAICSLAYEVIQRIMPWVIGQQKKKAH